MTTRLLKTSGLAALAAAMAVSAMPEESAARDNDRGGWSQRSGGGDRGSSRSNDSSPRTERSSPSPRSESRSDRSPPPARAEAPRQQSAPSNYTPPRQVSVPASRVETRAETRAPRAGGWTERRGPDRTERAPTRTEGNRGSDGGRDRSYGADRSRSSNGGSGRPTNYADARSAPTQGGNTNWNRDGDRDGRDGRGGDGRDGRDGDRNWGDRDGRDRDGNWRGRDGDRGGRWGDRDRDGNWRDRDRDHRRWDNRWRDNDRYNWSYYRDRNRSIFSLGLYYAPYRNYSYSRIGIGFYLDSLFFSSRYWIADPWQYRLPEVYGPYRWVRYYNDVVLVDIYTGEVVDVIYDFFW